MYLGWGIGSEADSMYFIITISVLAGGLLGSIGMYCLQRKQREQELKKMIWLTDEILNEREIKASASGEETLYARIEHQLVRVQELMQGRRDAAERSRDEIQKLIAEIAHQMRTPLMNMETYLGFLQENLEDLCISKGHPVTHALRGDQQQAAEQCITGAASIEPDTGNRSSDIGQSLQYTAAIENSGQKLHFLVESFIKMSRLEQHIIQIKKEEKDILKTLRNSLGQIQPQAETKGIQFDISLLENAAFLHDPNWLGEAVFNIMENAVKYSEAGGRVEVSMSQNEMYLKIRVRDYGIGIGAGEENQIFQRFYRGLGVTTQEGFGIGLYLSREIVNRHGGFLVAKRMHPGLMLELCFPSALLEVC